MIEMRHEHIIINDDERRSEYIARKKNLNVLSGQRQRKREKEKANTKSQNNNKQKKLIKIRAQET